MLTCKTAYAKTDTTHKNFNLITEFQLKHGGFVRLNILLYALHTISYSNIISWMLLNKIIYKLIKFNCFFNTYQMTCIEYLDLNVGNILHKLFRILELPSNASLLPRINKIGIFKLCNCSGVKGWWRACREMTPSNIVLNHSPTALFTSGSYPKAQRVVLFLIGFKGKTKISNWAI